MIYLFAVPGVLLLGVIFQWIMKVPSRGVYLAFFATGILETISLGPLREKFGLTELAIILTWFSMLSTNAWKNDKTKLTQLTQLQKLSLIFLSIFIICEWVSFFINNSIFYGYMTGSLVEVLNYTYGAMMVLTVLLLIDSWDKFKYCIYAWLLGGVVVSVVGVWAMTGSAPSWTIDEFTGRISSTLKFENQIPAFIVPILLTAIAMTLSRSSSKLLKIGLFFLIILMSITMVGTGSRTAFLLLVLTIMTLLPIAFIERSNKDLYKGRLGLLGIILSLGLFGYVTAALSAFDGNYSLGHTPPWQRPVVVLYNSLTGTSNTIDKTRTGQAEVIFENIESSMIIGNGPKLYGFKYRVSEIHNTYAGIYTEAGIAGLTFFILFLLASGYTALYTRKIEPEGYYRLVLLATFFGFILLLLYGMTMYGLRQRNIWLLAGLLIASHSFVIRKPTVNN
ncbi:O-antigen ligase family protein [Vibrio sp. FJH11]